MKLELFEKPKKGAVIIEGFPGFGLVSTIVTEFLIDHLDAKLIGRFASEKIPAIIAMHKGKIVEPFGIFYDEKNNIVIVRAIASVTKLEWEITKSLLDLYNEIKAKEFISIEGVSAEEGKKSTTAFYYSEDKQKARSFEKIGLKPLEEGIIVGVTAALLAKLPQTTFLFVEATSELPDSRAAAKIIEVLDKYLGLKVDYKPLLEKAEKFEKKIKEILVKGFETIQEKAKKETGYVG
jgi:uncharacterized protein